jgi:hypothetical protein
MNAIIISIAKNDLRDIGVGAQYIHYALRARGHRSTLLCVRRDADGGVAVGAIAEFVRDRQVSLVGLSVMSMHHDAAAGLSDAIRQALPGALIL